MKPQKRPANARVAAIAAIGQVLDDKLSLVGLNQPSAGLDPRDQAFARHLSYGVLRWLPALEFVVDQLLNKPLKRRDRDIKRLAMMGTFQLWKDASADHAAVHATAECARIMGKPWAVGLVNALLRRFQREQEQILSVLEQSCEQYAHPVWLLDKIKADWPDHWKNIVNRNNLQALLYLRVNSQRADFQDYFLKIQQQGFKARNHPRASNAVSIEPAVAVEKIPGFSEGLVSVQDPAAQLAADLVDPKPGERILDACAAPGGKTGHLLERAPGINLMALDRDPDRLKLVRENLHRLGLECSLQTADAGRPEQWWDGEPFDKILLDAPCSTTGVIRRHPEIKYLRSQGQVTKAVRIQKKLLESLWPLLNKGGSLVYATCSILKSENHEQIHGFLSRHPEAQLIGPGENANHVHLPGQQIFPGEEGMDGFYYAVIRKSD